MCLSPGCFSPSNPLLLTWTHAFSTCSFFFFNDTATTEIYTLPLHDALPISLPGMLRADERRHRANDPRHRAVSRPHARGGQRALSAEDFLDQRELVGAFHEKGDVTRGIDQRQGHRHALRWRLRAGRGNHVARRFREGRGAGEERCRVALLAEGGEPE